MACSCGKNRKLPVVRSVPRGEGVAGRTWFWAVPPGEDPAVRFETLREARQHAQKQRGPGWLIEGRWEADG